MTTSPILGYARETGKYRLTTDACDVEAVEHNRATLEDALVAVRAGKRLRFKNKLLVEEDSSDEMVSHSNMKIN